MARHLLEFAAEVNETIGLVTLKHLCGEANPSESKRAVDGLQLMQGRHNA